MLDRAAMASYRGYSKGVVRAFRELDKQRDHLFALLAVGNSLSEVDQSAFFSRTAYVPTLLAYKAAIKRLDQGTDLERFIGRYLGRPTARALWRLTGAVVNRTASHTSAQSTSSGCGEQDQLLPATLTAAR